MSQSRCPSSACPSPAVLAAPVPGAQPQHTVTSTHVQHKLHKRHNLSHLYMIKTVPVPHVPVPLSQFRMSQSRVSQVQQFAYYLCLLYKQRSPQSRNRLICDRNRCQIRPLDSILRPYQRVAGGRRHQAGAAHHFLGYGRSVRLRSVSYRWITVRSDGRAACAC